MSIFSRSDDDTTSGLSGSWSITSKKDSRWNKTDGKAKVIALTAGTPEEITQYIQMKKEELKCEPPDDLEYICMKD